MNCLNRISIQEYIDKELDLSQIKEIDAHLQECKVCSLLLEDANSDIGEIKDFLSQLDGDEDSITVPEFIPNDQKKRSIYSRVISSLPLKLAAGIALLLGLFFILRTNVSSPKLASEDADLLLLELLGNTDPNEAWHTGEMAIILVNEKGEVIESYLSSEN